jgi:hypothetical protein
MSDSVLVARDAKIKDAVLQQCVHSGALTWLGSLKQVWFGGGGGGVFIAMGLEDQQFVTEKWQLYLEDGRCLELLDCVMLEVWRGRKAWASVSELEKDFHFFPLLCGERETQRWFPRLQIPPDSFALQITPGTTTARLHSVWHSRANGSWHLWLILILSDQLGLVFESCKDRKLSSRKLG